jgi:hypothetical protein
MLQLPPPTPFEPEPVLLFELQPRSATRVPNPTERRADFLKDIDGFPWALGEGPCLSFVENEVSAHFRDIEHKAFARAAFRISE